MSFYGELDPMPEHKTQFSFKGKREYKDKVNIPHLAYPNQHLDFEIQYGSRDHGRYHKNYTLYQHWFNRKNTQYCNRAIIELTEPSAKKKVLKFGSKETDAISNTDIYGTCRDLYLSEKNVKRNCFKVYNQLFV